MIEMLKVGTEMRCQGGNEISTEHGCESPYSDSPQTFLRHNSSHLKVDLIKRRHAVQMPIYLHGTAKERLDKSLNTQTHTTDVQG